MEYDAVGNIKKLKRNTDAQLMDDLTYFYKHNSNGELVQNRLYHVNENQTNNDLASNDIDYSPEGNIEAIPSNYNQSNVSGSNYSYK